MKTMNCKSCPMFWRLRVRRFSKLRSGEEVVGTTIGCDEQEFRFGDLPASLDLGALECELTTESRVLMNLEVRVQIGGRASEVHLGTRSVIPEKYKEYLEDGLFLRLPS